MRRCWLPFLVFLVAASSLRAQTDEAARASAALAAGRFEEAWALHADLLARTPRPSAALLANAGQAAFRVGEPVTAVALFHRALARDPTDAATRFDLDLARRQLGLGPLPERDGLARALDAADALPPGSLLLLVGGLQALGLALFVLRPALPGRRTLAWTLVVGGLALGARRVQTALLPPPPLAVVQHTVLPVRPAPHASLTAPRQLQRGEDVRVLATSERWARIAHARGTGWVPRAGLRFADTP